MYLIGSGHALRFTIGLSKRLAYLLGHWLSQALALVIRGMKCVFSLEDREKKRIFKKLRQGKELQDIQCVVGFLFKATEKKHNDCAQVHLWLCWIMINIWGTSFADVVKSIQKDSTV